MRNGTGFILIAVVAAGMIAGAFMGNHPAAKPKQKKPVQLSGTWPSKTPLHDLEYSPYLVKSVVSKQLRNPSSAVFGDMFVVGDRKIGKTYSGAVCGSVNSKNGFGGYAGDTSFIYLMMTGTAVIDPRINNRKFVKLYNGVCAGHHDG